VASSVFSGHYLTAPTAGADFHFHEPVLESQGDTLTADPKGGTSVTFSLITAPLAGAYTRSLSGST